MKTSYYSKIKSLKLTPKNLVSIAAKKPDWIDCREYKKLAPNYSFFSKYKKDGNEKDYIKSYESEILDNLDPKIVYEELGENAILLCWENSDKFCHRHLVSNWLKEELNIEIEEL